MGLGHSPKIVTTNLLLNVDATNIKSYSNSSNTAIVNTIDATKLSIFNNTWISFTGSALTFTRAANTSPNPKIGGTAFISANGALLSQNFLYNDHTWEVWVKIDDRTPGAYDVTEGFSGITAYRGYHAGFTYTASTITYQIWDSVGPTGKTAASWTLGTSGTQIIEGQWTQIAVTKSSNTYTAFVNGVQSGTGSTTAANVFNGVSNTLCIGGINYSTTPGLSSYCGYPKNTFSNMKMYNRALSADEIKQNFNALRGRFGI